MTDEQHIRELIATWHRETAAGNVSAILPLMAEDVVFLVAGRPPMRGRQEFGQGLATLLETHRIESSGEIQELAISGDLACCWTHLTVSITPRTGGASNQRRGSTLSVLRRQPDGRWVVSRDANLLGPA